MRKVLKRTLNIKFRRHGRKKDWLVENRGTISFSQQVAASNNYFTLFGLLIDHGSSEIKCNWLSRESNTNKSTTLWLVDKWVAIIGKIQDMQC